jgi:nucleoid-associated protein YgaU
MGCVEQAVLEFDEEVQAPWRPRLVSEPVLVEPVDAPVLRRAAAGRSSSRVGVCRPPAPGGLPSRIEQRVRPGGVARGSAGRAPADRVRAGRPRSTRVRLTRRARRLAVVLALCGGVVLGSLLDSLVSGGAGDGLHLAGVSSVVVEPGDTLWSIAESVAGGADVRDVVDRIQELNRLEGSSLEPGQVLQLP